MMKYRPSQDLIAQIFAPIVSRPCWGVKRVHGSIVSMEFGYAVLPIRPSPVSLQRKARNPDDPRPIKMLGATGEWNFTLVDACWIVSAGGLSVHYLESPNSEIEHVLTKLNGQTLIDANWTADSRLILNFAPNAQVEAGFAEHADFPLEPDDALWWLLHEGGPNATLTADDLIEMSKV